jgi:hypothetical protein
VLDGHIKIWEILAWFAGLLVVVFIDALKEMQQRRPQAEEPDACLDLELGQDPVPVRGINRGQVLLDKSA